MSILSISVLAHDGEEETGAGCWGDGETDGEVILGVWDTADGGSFIQVPGAIIVVLQKRLAGGGTETPEGAGKMGTAGEDFGKVWSRKENGGEVLCGGGASGDSIWV